MEKKKIEDKEIIFLYELLYAYEHGELKRTTDKRFLKKNNDAVKIDNNFSIDCNIKQEIDDCLQFSPYGNNKCGAILYHIRNAFAHGNIYSVNNDKDFLILDYSDRSKRSKCNMLGIVSKKKFKKMIEDIKTSIKKKKS